MLNNSIFKRQQYFFKANSKKQYLKYGWLERILYQLLKNFFATKKIDIQIAK